MFCSMVSSHLESGCQWTSASIYIYNIKLLHGWATLSNDPIEFRFIPLRIQAFRGESAVGSIRDLRPFDSDPGCHFWALQFLLARAESKTLETLTQQWIWTNGAALRLWREDAVLPKGFVSRHASPRVVARQAMAVEDEAKGFCHKFGYKFCKLSYIFCIFLLRWIL